MTVPIIRITQTGGQGTFMTLLELDTIRVQVSINRPDPYTHEFVGPWSGHRFAIVEAGGNRLIRFINFTPVWNLANLNLELILSSVNLNGSSAGQTVKQQLNTPGSALTFNSTTELGLSYTAVRTA